ncbi:MAG: transposase [Chloroflexi bacterium]|nr:transposase [Chloroflexota bacterium]
MTLPLQAQYLALESARQRQETKAFRKPATRAGVEGTISQAAYALEMRRTRYRGLTKTHFTTCSTALPLTYSELLIGCGKSLVPKLRNLILRVWRL